MLQLVCMSGTIDVSYNICQLQDIHGKLHRLIELFYKLSINIVHSLYYALIYLDFSWLYKERFKGLLQLEKIMVYTKTCYFFEICQHKKRLFAVHGWSH